MTDESAVLLSEQSVNKKNPSHLAVVLASIGILFSVISVIAIGMLYSLISDLQTQNRALTGKLDDLTRQAADTETKVTKIDSSISKNLMLLNLTYLQHEIEGGVVTDDFVVKKVTFFPDDKDVLNANMDIDIQPDMYVKYKGKGSFDLPDRELRSKASNIIQKVETYYVKNAGPEVPKWDDKARVHLTIKNYEIGTLENGQFNLTGEKK